ncbi:hypothetical protein SAMN06265795_12224 [Noviherbaspirillum humi]|uniref:Uncharacterized protein n=1 Tax=Noviherbaspirillum humi TaxID=1688639 RepID=A0A239LEH8_9BURK|nr:hypothetical protein [Noviherbaspirillum humi]SNT28710.1 hypothetical protein SAMN06265795_12224 [Noviherbaspirillum humi]
MKLDRALQRELLELLAVEYPNTRECVFTPELSDEVNERRIANLLYLEEHGLVESGLRSYMDGNYASTGSRITARGLDFLADDGGMSAILGTVTVKLHDDTIRSLMELTIEKSDLPPPEKKKWTDALRSLPADAIKHLTMKLLGMGLDHTPDAIHAMRTFLFP